MLTALLFGVEALDELLAGIPSLGSPDIQTEFALSYSALALLVLVAPQLVSLVLEPPLFLLADRYPRKRFVCGGLLAMGLCAIVAGMARSPVVLAIALMGWYLGSGCGVGLSQAVLVDARPDQRERTMTWWTFFGALGDLAAPTGFALLAAWSLGWRAGFLLCGALCVILALAAWRQTFPAPLRASPGEVPTIGTSIRNAMGNRPLLWWLTASWLCDLLDEILFVFASLRLRNELGLGPVGQSLVLSAFVFGNLLGLLVTDRLLRRASSLRVLRGACWGCAIAYSAWLLIENPVASAVCLFLVGAFCAPLYPIVQAQAYRALPTESGMVNALGNLFAPLSLMVPLVLGLIAESAGLLWALLALIVQPLGILWIARFRSGTSTAGTDGPDPPGIR